MSDLPEAYYLPIEGGFLATEATSSPWDEAAQHGGPPTALLAACIDDAIERNDLRLARISVDFLGPMPRSEVRVEVEVLRSGRRTQLHRATMWAAERQVAVARTWHIVTDGSSLSARTGDPEPLPEPEGAGSFGGDPSWGYGRAIEWRPVAGRAASPDASAASPDASAVWTRVRVPLVAGWDLDGQARFLIVADSANGLSAPFPMDEWWFIPPGVTMHLLRAPVGEWVRLAATSDPGTDGIGLTEGTLSDRWGRCGTVTQPILVARR